MIWNVTLSFGTGRTCSSVRSILLSLGITYVLLPISLYTFTSLGWLTLSYEGFLSQNLKVSFHTSWPVLLSSSLLACTGNPSLRMYLSVPPCLRILYKTPTTVTDSRTLSLVTLYSNLPKWVIPILILLRS